ncbi:MAG TPA: PilZ domain-containing protein [Candidatus Angelobacter sp.]
MEIPQSRRKNTRYHCIGGVELRRQEGSPAIFGNLTDISLEGCYVETVSTLPSESEVVFMLKVSETVIRGRAVIKVSNHAVGMGLEFMHLATEDQQKLDFLVGTLAGVQEMRPPEQRRVVAEDPIPAPRPLTTPTRPVPTASMTSPTKPPAQSTSPLSQKIMRTINEVNDLEQFLVKERLDPRLIAQFHDAVGHLRQTAWTMQQWVELNATGGDPFEVLPQLEAERMQMLTKLAHNVNADIDATSINEFTLGVSELYETMEGLYRRLRKMLIVDDGSSL